MPLKQEEQDIADSILRLLSSVPRERRASILSFVEVAHSTELEALEMLGEAPSSPLVRGRYTVRLVPVDELGPDPKA